MPVYHVRRCVARGRRRKDANLLVRQIRIVIDTIGGRMGQKNIESAMPPQRKPQTAHALVHFVLGILMGLLFIENGTAQS